MDDINFVSPQEVDLTSCDREAIHIPGSIQPQGVLFVLQEPQLKILQISNNTDVFLGIPADSLVNQDLKTLFPPSQIELLNQCASEENPEIFNPIRLSVENQYCSLVFNGTIHRSGELLILEIEPVSFWKQPVEASFYQSVKSSLLKVNRTADFCKMIDLVVKEIRKVTEYDRVMLYRFESDETGIIIAEDKKDGLESYLDLHYPASDIPKQARVLYYENWLRLITDMNYEPVEIIPAINPLTNAPVRSKLLTIQKRFFSARRVLP